MFLNLTTSFTFKYMLLLWSPLYVQYFPTFSFHTLKKAGLINILENLKQLTEGILIIFLYF